MKYKIVWEGIFKETGKIYKQKQQYVVGTYLSVKNYAHFLSGKVAEFYKIIVNREYEVYKKQDQIQWEENFKGEVEIKFVIYN